jgi:predicted nucleic acid-binding protein
MRVLLDNDVVLDFLLIRHPFYAAADEIFVRLQNKEFEAFISTITPINAFYTTRKEKGKDVAFKAVEGLVKIVEICRTDKSVLQNAFALGFTDFEDAVQCASAMAENLDAIVTRNTKDYKNSTVKIYSPNEFLQVL